MQLIASPRFARASPLYVVVIGWVSDEGLLCAGGSGARDEGRTPKGFTGAGLNARSTRLVYVVTSLGTTSALFTLLSGDGKTQELQFKCKQGLRENAQKVKPPGTYIRNHTLAGETIGRVHTETNTRLRGRWGLMKGSGKGALQYRCAGLRRPRRTPTFRKDI